eukprot:scaffold48_cov395-Prasinococcus_capsulatus_cf.AAC.25
MTCISHKRGGLFRVPVASCASSTERSDDNCSPPNAENGTEYTRRGYSHILGLMGQQELSQYLNDVPSKLVRGSRDLPRRCGPFRGSLKHQSQNSETSPSPSKTNVGSIRNNGCAWLSRIS